MRISFDMDGTATDPAHVDFLRELAKAWQAAGHEYGILTGHKQASEEHDRQRLRDLGYPEPDFYYGRTPEYMHLNGAHRKSDIIKELGIVAHFDDYDYDHPDTNRLFPELGQWQKVFRCVSTKEAMS